MSVSTHCVVYGCPNKGSQTSAFKSNVKQVTFHKFPNKDSAPTLYNKWIENINRDHFTPLKGSVLCSIHFTEESFECGTPSLLYAPTLKPTAVPTLYMGKPPSNLSVAILNMTKTAESNARKRKKKLDDINVRKSNVQKQLPITYKPLRKVICPTTNELEMPPARPGFVNVGVQCEMGKETYRSQPGVVIPEEEMEYDRLTESNSSSGTSSESDDSYHVTSTGVETESDRSSVVDMNVEEDDIQTPSSTIQDDTKRAGKSDWCKCGSCTPMPSEDESNCCNDLGLPLKIKNEDPYDCITLHKSFRSVVLDVHALNVSRHCMILNSTSLDAKLELKNRLTNRLWRHIAYKQFIHWINSWISLGQNSIRSVPACVINQIRKEFPATQNLYNHDFLAGKRGFEPDYFD